MAWLGELPTFIEAAEGLGLWDAGTGVKIGQVPYWVEEAKWFADKLGFKGHKRHNHDHSDWTHASWSIKRDEPVDTSSTPGYINRRDKSYNAPNKRPRQDPVVPRNRDNLGDSFSAEQEPAPTTTPMPGPYDPRYGNDSLWTMRGTSTQQIITMPAYYISHRSRRDTSTPGVKDHSFQGMRQWTVQASVPGKSNAQEGCVWMTTNDMIGRRQHMRELASLGFNGPSVSNPYMLEKLICDHEEHQFTIKNNSTGTADVMINYYTYMEKCNDSLTALIADTTYETNLNGAAANTIGVGDFTSVHPSDSFAFSPWRHRKKVMKYTKVMATRVFLLTPGQTAIFRVVDDGPRILSDTLLNEETSGTYASGGVTVTGMTYNNLYLPGYASGVYFRCRPADVVDAAGVITLAGGKLDIVERIFYKMRLGYDCRTWRWFYTAAALATNTAFDNASGALGTADPMGGVPTTTNAAAQDVNMETDGLETGVTSTV